MTRRRLPRNDAAILDAQTLLEGEIAYDTTNQELRIGDGTTVGGVPVGGTPDLTGLATEADLAADTGAEMIGAKRTGITGTWAQPKTALDYILDSAVSITEAGAVQDYDFDLGTGTNNSTANLTNLFADPKVGRIFVPPGQKGFMIGSTISLDADTCIVGAPIMSTQATTKNAPISKIAFRPTNSDKVAIKATPNTGTIWGQGVENLGIDCNNVEHNAIQFATSYSNKARNIHLFGTMSCGIVVDTTYVIDIDGLYAGGTVQFKRAILAIGDSNAISVRGFHSSNLPLASTDRVFGILMNGLCHGALLDMPVVQGQTVGIFLGSGAQAVTINQPYFENTVVPLSLGEGTSGPQGVSLIGGAWAGPYPEHSQYAERGPIILNTASTGLTWEGWRLQFQADPTNVKGPWPMVCGAGAAHIRIGPGSQYNDPGVAGNPTYADLLMMTSAGNSPTYRVDGFDQDDHGEAFTLQKVDGTYGGVGRRISMDNTGAWVTSAYTPTVIPAAVSTLITATAPTVTSLLR